MDVSVAKWGNSLGVRIPKRLAEKLGLREGARVEMEAEGDRLVISRRRPRYTLEEVLANVTPEVRTAFDWGPDVGREIIED
jgi:antitoxin MazE